MAIGAAVAAGALNAASAAPAQSRPASWSTSSQDVLRAGPLPGANGPAFTRGGDLAVTSAQAGRISIVDPRSGAITRRFGPTSGLQTPDDVATGPDGSLFWTGFLTGLVGRIAPDGSSRTIANVGPGANPIAFGPDGRRFTARCALGDAVYELDPDGRRAPRLIAENIGAGCAANALDVGPDGRLYAPQPFLGRVVAIDVDSGGGGAGRRGLRADVVCRRGCAGRNALRRRRPCDQPDRRAHRRSRPGRRPAIPDRQPRARRRREPVRLEPQQRRGRRGPSRRHDAGGGARRSRRRRPGTGRRAGRVRRPSRAAPRGRVLLWLRGALDGACPSRKSMHRRGLPILGWVAATDNDCISNYSDGEAR